MTLLPNEHAELRQLLIHHQQGLLSPGEQMRLRELLARQNPRATTMPLEDLVKVGLFALGLFAVSRAVRG